MCEEPPGASCEWHGEIRGRLLRDEVRDQQGTDHVQPWEGL